jgi:GcrA cell cycle regulator
MLHHVWTNELDQFIKNAIHAEKIGINRIADRLGMPRSAVHDRAIYLGCRRPPAWDQWQVDMLLEEWPKGTSTRIIGGLIGKTKNAVVGKVHRLKLPNRAARNGYHTGAMPKDKVQAVAAIPTEKPVAAPKPPVVKEMIKLKKPTAPKFFPQAGPISAKPPIGIMELNNNTCKAIVGHGHNGLAVYCGDMTFAGKPYCASHCAIYYNYEHKPRRRA